MGKLVIKFQGKLVGEVDLKLGDTKIGRKPANDIVLDDAAVSGEHAVLKMVGVKAFIQDLGSTNGTFVENNRVKLFELKSGQTIIIGGHSLIYREGLNLDAPVFGKQAIAPTPAPGSDDGRKTTVITPFAQLIVAEGPNKGKRMALVKEVNTIDNPGKNPARISRTSEGYLIEAAVGPGEPRLNDRPVMPGGQLLELGDIIEVAETKYQFFK
jgi:pSer/pThr/pTyr-binding forkhead associated (FHA) protein